MVDHARLQLGADRVQALGEVVFVPVSILVLFQGFSHTLMVDGRRIAHLFERTLLGQCLFCSGALFVDNELALDESVFGLSGLGGRVHERIGESDAFSCAKGRLGVGHAVEPIAELAEAVVEWGI